MKYLVFAFVLVICASSALAEDYTMTTYYPAPSGVYSILKADRIGLPSGTADPTLAALDVNQPSGAAPGSAIKFGSQGFLVSPSTIISDNARWAGAAWANVNNAVSAAMDLSAGQIKFYTAPAGVTPAWTTPVTITNTGLVGVGNVSPIGPLTVGNSAIDGSDGYLVIGKRAGGGTRHFRLGFDPSFKFIIGDYGNMNAAGAWVSAFNMDWNTPANTLTLNGSGQVGIGMAASGAVLDVAGNIQTTGYGHFKGWPGGGTGLGAEIGISGGEGYVLAFDRTGGSYANLNLQSNASVVKLNTNGKIGVTTTGFGIGVAAPGEMLEVNGNLKMIGGARSVLNNGGNSILEMNSGDWLRINMGQSYTTGIAMYQPVAIGPGWGLYVGNWLNNAGAGNIVAVNDITALNGNMYANQYLHVSDERVKEDIAPLTNALEKVRAMNGVYFKYKNKPGKHVGLIAQNVEKVVPEVVVTGRDGMKAVDYSNLVAVLIEAIKEQQKQILELEKGLKMQRAELENLKKSKQ